MVKPDKNIVLKKINSVIKSFSTLFISKFLYTCCETLDFGNHRKNFGKNRSRKRQILTYLVYSYKVFFSNLDNNLISEC